MVTDSKPINFSNKFRQVCNKLAKVFGFLSLGLIAGCNMGNKMKAEEFFTPEMVLLLKTLKQGDEEKAKFMINDGLKLNSHGDEGITPLFWLMLERDLKAIELALILGADPNFTTPEGGHPVATVVGDGDDDILALLLKYGGDANAVDLDGFPAIFSSIGHDNWVQINMLLDAGADLNKTDLGQRNAPLYASFINKYESAYKLIELGAEHHKASSGGITLAWNIYSDLEDKLLNPEFEAYGWAIKTRELLIKKGIKFPPLSPEQVRERVKNGEAIN
ncbi:ankyrin repeat domain-containing protein [Thalassomonas viridans]|uniref:Ankyrin repeat domain-containing protein n=1 Tax=Thalassomonas viridans TaxID=137584 RepID=A0AAE9YZT8_9GAMM|nr:ankyrin repeat domain-containing protein [Thalassomonas viridans]WDE03424.1 ankyrin repeat domain-containing protein [Thalassomonas viridans]